MAGAMCDVLSADTLGFTGHYFSAFCHHMAQQKGLLEMSLELITLGD